MDPITTTSTNTAAPVVSVPAPAGLPTHGFRISQILKAIAVLAAEFGPQFFHSQHGQGLLLAGETSISILAGLADGALGGN